MELIFAHILQHICQRRRDPPECQLLCHIRHQRLYFGLEYWIWVFPSRPACSVPVGLERWRGCFMAFSRAVVIIFVSTFATGKMCPHLFTFITPHLAHVLDSAAIPDAVLVSWLFVHCKSYLSWGFSSCATACLPPTLFLVNCCRKQEKKWRGKFFSFQVGHQKVYRRSELNEKICL